MQSMLDAMSSCVRSIPQDWKAFSWQRKFKSFTPRANIIFVTVCSENEHAKAVMRLKPSGYLTKEATNAQIQEELKNLRYPIT